MRTLLEIDEKTLNDLKIFIKENKATKEPDKSKPINCLAKLHIGDLSTHSIVHQIPIEKIVTEFLNDREEFCLDAYESEEEGVYLKVKGIGFEPCEEWKQKLKDRDHLVELSNKGYKLLNSLVTNCDYRNFFEKDGYLMYGKREKNTENAYLLGDIVSAKKIISIDEYDDSLLRLKNNN
jgi:hypothetical protein